MIKQESHEIHTLSAICCSEWFNHFSTLLYDYTAEPVVINVMEPDAFLNSEITNEEILQSYLKTWIK